MILKCLSLFFLSHLSAAVRASTAQQLRLLADTMGAAAVLSAGKTFSTRFVTAVCKTSLDAAAEVRSVIKLGIYFRKCLFRLIQSCFVQ